MIEFVDPKKSVTFHLSQNVPTIHYSMICNAEGYECIDLQRTEINFEFYICVIEGRPMIVNDIVYSEYRKFSISFPTLYVYISFNLMNHFLKRGNSPCWLEY